MLVTGGLNKLNRTLGDVWLLDVEGGKWRKVYTTFAVDSKGLCMVEMFQGEGVIRFFLYTTGEFYCKSSCWSLSHCTQCGSRTNRGIAVWRFSHRMDGIL